MPYTSYSSSKTSVFGIPRTTLLGSNLYIKCWYAYVWNCSFGYTLINATMFCTHKLLICQSLASSVYEQKLKGSTQAPFARPKQT